MIPLLDKESRGGTRERIIELLLDERRTIDSLARALKITKNAVRSQIALLEREGVVEASGEEKGSRRPAAIYGIRSGVEVGASRADPLVLAGLVQALKDRISPKQFQSIMKDVGAGIASTLPVPSGDPRARVTAAVRALRSLGSLAEVAEEDGTLVIKGHGCLIAKAVQANERSCAAMESLLEALTGLPVTERCMHGERPSCRFEVRLKKSAGEKK